MSDLSEDDGCSVMIEYKKIFPGDTKSSKFVEGEKKQFLMIFVGITSRILWNDFCGKIFGMISSS